MNNPPPGSSCANSQVPTTTVQSNDAQVAAGCTAQAQSIQNPPAPPGGHQICFVDGNGCPCDPDCTPIILDIGGEGFHLTSAEAGVMFDISGTGHPVQIAWTDSHFHNAFLALPGPDGLVHNGTELFGNFTPQPQSAHPNGFLALAQYASRKTVETETALLTSTIKSSPNCVYGLMRTMTASASPTNSTGCRNWEFIRSH